HRVAAADLISALPAATRSQATVLETQCPADLRQLSTAHAAAEADVPTAEPLLGPGAIRSPRSWLLGIGFSLATAFVILGSAWSMRPKTPPVDEPLESAKSVTDTAPRPQGTLPQPASVAAPSHLSGPAKGSVPPDEEAIRAWREAVLLVG